MSRNEDFQGIALQNRDFDVLRGLFESRVMTLSQAATLYFEGRKEAAKKRVQKLKGAGLIRERKRKMYEPSVLFLTRMALTLLSNHSFLTAYPQLSLTQLEKRAQVSELTLRHELQVMDVKAAMASGVAALPAFTIAEFSTWPQLNEFRVQRPSMNGYGQTSVLVKPDGFIRLHEQNNGETSEYTFFLEVDRSTEKLEILCQRAACYGAYYRTGGFAMRCGGASHDYQNYPFRVLMVFKTAERRNNIAEQMLICQPPILTQVWLTTLGELLDDPMAAIWVRPIDYRDLMSKTPFDVTRKGKHGAFYRRSSERDILVEERIKKYALLNGDR